MTGTTAPLGFTYPEGTDDVTDGNEAIEDLAKKANALLGVPETVYDYSAGGGTALGLMNGVSADWTTHLVVRRLGLLCFLEGTATYTGAGFSAPANGNAVNRPVATTYHLVPGDPVVAPSPAAPVPLGPTPLGSFGDSSDVGFQVRVHPTQADHLMVDLITAPPSYAVAYGFVFTFSGLYMASAFPPPNYPTV